MKIEDGQAASVGVGGSAEFAERFKDKKVAIVHYWLVNMRGGEKVLEGLIDLFPEADIYTHVIDPENISSEIRSKNINTTFISKLPFAKKFYKLYLPFMPYALECLDLTSYDLIISSESGPAKGIIPSPDATHICYCHSPMRYIWDLHYEYRKDLNFIAGKFLSIVSHYLRMQDVSSAARVDQFIANSQFVARRIQKYYRRDAVVINPPVDTNGFYIDETVGDGEEPYYLVAGELVGYKRADIAIEAFNQLGLRLIIIGGGPEFDKLAKLAGPNVELKGKVPQSEFVRYMQGCKALVFPGEEDFGIVPIEAMACGKPVIAFKSGGALDYVVEGKTGLFFKKQDAAELMACVSKLESFSEMFAGDVLRAAACQYDASQFKEYFKEAAISSYDFLHS